jgi:tetratricopeptide (TPR) repeat protein
MTKKLPCQKISFLFISLFAILLSFQSSYANEQIRLSADPTVEIFKIWGTRNDIVNLGKDKLGLNELGLITGLMTDYEIRNIPQITLEILDEIKNRSEELSSKDVLTLIEAAVKISPDIPAAHFEMAKLCFRFENLDPKRGFSELSKGTQAFLENIDLANTFYANIAYWIILGLFSSIALFFIVLAVKYLVLLAHLCGHLCGPDFSRIAIFAILIGLPLTFFSLLGIAGLIAILIIYFWLFSTTQEKVVLILVTIALAALPIFFYAPQFMIKYQGSPEREMLSIRMSPDYASKLNLLSEILRKNPLDSEAKFLTALIIKKTGNLEKAQELLDQLIKQNPNWEKPLINRGNIEFLKGRLNSAISYYSRAATLNNTNFLAKYNLGKCYFIATKIEEANAELKNASGLDDERFRKYEEVADPTNPLRYIFDEWIEKRDLKNRIDAMRKPDNQMAARLWNEIGVLKLPPLWSSLAAIICLVLIIILAKAKRAIDPPKTCEICGTPYCKRCSKLIDKRQACAQCHYIFVLKESIDLGSRAKKEAQGKRHEIKQRILGRWSSLIVPGFSHVYIGSTIKGLIVTFIFFTAVYKIFIPDGILVNPYRLAPTVLNYPNLSCAIVAIVIYIMVNLDLRKAK